MTKYRVEIPPSAIVTAAMLADAQGYCDDGEVVCPSCSRRCGSPLIHAEGSHAYPLEQR